MYIIGQCLDPSGKFNCIDDDVTGAIPAHLPAVIDHNVPITRLLHPRGDHRIGYLPDDLFIDTVTGEFVPAVPPHGRCLGKVFEFLGPCGQDIKNGDADQHRRYNTDLTHS